MGGIEKPFSRLRAFLWPIHGHEMRKFLPLFLLAFFIGFNYNILRNMKDALIITAESSGAEVIPFIKVWGMIPGALLITFVYSRLNNKLKRDQVFYTMIAIFLAFFALFAFVLFPIREHLHFHRGADFLQSHLPTGCLGLVAMLRYWLFSSFYIMSELWSSAVLSMLFWGFANEVTRLGEAKRFYALIAIGLNLAAIFSGQAVVFISGSIMRSWVHLKENPWEQTLFLLTFVMLGCGLMIVIIYRYLTKKVLIPGEYLDSKKPNAVNRPKIKMSMRENFAYLMRSKYLSNIALIVLAYNVVINLIEVLWKDQVNQLYPNPNDYAAYMSQVTSITGVISLFISLLISGQIIRKFGWTFTAIATPVILLVTSVGFFILFFGQGSLLGLIASLNTTPLILLVFFGSAQNCLCRSAKFTLFDATKEMAFIPLSMESKLKGKAAIDGVGSRLGKSCGSIVHQGLLMTFSSISASAPYVAGLLLGFISIWMYAIRSLGLQFQKLTTTNETLPTSEALTPIDSLAPEEEPAPVSL